MAEKFDFQAMLMSIESEQSIIGKKRFLAPLVKQLTIMQRFFQ